MRLGTRKATRQPYQCMSGTIRNGATALPIIDALLKMPTANARSRTGNHCATTLLPPEKLPHSPVPSQNRKKLKCSSEVATACRALAMDHHITAKVSPKRAPRRSISQPIGNSPKTMPIWKEATMMPYCVFERLKISRSFGAVTDSVWRSTKLIMVTQKSIARIHQRRCR